MAPAELFKEELDRIEGAILRLKREYDLFFQGNRRSEPGAERRAVEEMIRRTGQRRIVNTTDQFRFNNLQSRFYSFVNMWPRIVRDLEEGRLAREGAGGGGRPSPGAGVPVEAGHLDRVLDQLARARRECGLAAEEADLSAIRQTLLDRAAELARRPGVGRVEFKVTVEGGKPKVRAVVPKDGLKT